MDSEPQSVHVLFEVEARLAEAIPLPAVYRLTDRHAVHGVGRQPFEPRSEFVVVEKLRFLEQRAQDRRIAGIREADKAIAPSPRRDVPTRSPRKRTCPLAVDHHGIASVIIWRYCSHQFHCVSSLLTPA